MMLNWNLILRRLAQQAAINGRVNGRLGEDLAGEYSEKR